MSKGGFNPRPALLPGESIRPLLDKDHSHVSIHARHCCRANLGHLQTRVFPRSFNPRPALLPGESLVQWPVYHAGLVSIHARHCCRANPR